MDGNVDTAGGTQVDIIVVVIVVVVVVNPATAQVSMADVLSAGGGMMRFTLSSMEADCKGVEGVVWPSRRIAMSLKLGMGLLGGFSAIFPRTDFSHSASIASAFCWSRSTSLNFSIEICPSAGWLVLASADSRVAESKVLCP